MAALVESIRGRLDSKVGRSERESKPSRVVCTRTKTWRDSFRLSMSVLWASKQVCCPFRRPYMNQLALLSCFVFWHFHFVIIKLRTKGHSALSTITEHADSEGKWKTWLALFESALVCISLFFDDELANFLKFTFCKNSLPIRCLRFATWPCWMSNRAWILLFAYVSWAQTSSSSCRRPLQRSMKIIGSRMFDGSTSLRGRDF